MCGLVALFDPDGVPPGLVERGLDALRHRGPDGRGTWTERSGTVALGHARLAFTDLAGGAQPLANEDGTTVAVVNGEHYDDVRERQQLEARGHRFRTGSDAELFPHLWDERGEDAFEAWRGEFAAILWDARGRRLVAARDRFGAKPLVWARTGRRVLVASEARALFAMGLPRAWNHPAVRHALALQYTRPTESLFAGVHVLPPGHVLTVDAQGPRVRRWWDAAHASIEPIEPETAADRLRTSLDEAVRIRLRGEREVGALLSGGVDSASVAALASRHSTKPLRTFTVRFDEVRWDESVLAGEQAAAIGATHTEVVVGERQVVDAFEEAVTAGEGLAINGHVSSKWLLFKAIRDSGLAAVLTGEGSDELLLGYPHLRLDLAGDDPAALERLRRTNSATAGVQLPDGDGFPLDAIKSAFGYVPSFLRAKATLGARVRQVLRDDAIAREPDVAFIEAHAAARDAGRPPILRSARLWIETALATYILRTLGDAQEMAHGIEGRLPFLDPVVATFASSLPVEVRMRDSKEKWPLREAMHGVVVESVRTREKHPFMAPPLTLPGRAHARSWLLDLFDSAAARAQPFFDPTKVRERLLATNPEDASAAAAAEPVFLLCASLVVLQSRVIDARSDG